MYTYTRVHGRYTAVNDHERAVYEPCTGRRPVYTVVWAVYTVHGRAECITTILFAKGIAYAETYGYKSITFNM